MSYFLGKTIGDYQVIEVLDESGDTMVFKGFQPSMNRYVVLKILKPGVARNPLAVQQFFQQGELIAQMQHPNILEVYSSGQEEGLFYRAERLAEGGSLQDHLHLFRDPPQAFLFLKDIVGAVQYIHARGYIHGNLKPRNILMDARQSPLLADFGTPPSQAQMPSPYLAPEQVQGGMVDSRTDVYALGVLLFEIMTSQAPPTGVVVSLLAHRPDLPQALEQVVLKAMAQNPDQRFQTAGEFLAAMQVALQAPVPIQPYSYQQSAVPAPAPMVSQSVTVEGQKRGTNWVALILGIILVSILFIGGILGFRYLTQERGTETGVQLPIQPPAGPTIIVPTVVFPTQEPQPTQPPEQPTQPPEQPTQLPDEPPGEQLPDENPPQITEEPQDGRGGQLAGNLPESCGSIGFISFGVALVITARHRKRTPKK